MLLIRYFFVCFFKDHITNLDIFYHQMDIFLKHIVATVDSVDEKYDSWFLYKIMQTIQHQSVKFLAACSAGFEKFNLEECINSKSYENFNKVSFDILTILILYTTTVLNSIGCLTLLLTIILL